MKTKIKNTTILTLMLFIALAGLTSAQAQIGYDDGLYNYSTDGMIVNNYYVNDYSHDFYYASRIKRFHRPFVSVSYYGPIFTDSYWYTYQPSYIGYSIYNNYYDPYYGWGISINVPIYTSYYSSWYSGYYSPWYRVKYRPYYRSNYHWNNYHYSYYNPFHHNHNHNYYIGYRDYVNGYGYYSSRNRLSANRSNSSMITTANRSRYRNVERSGDQVRNGNRYIGTRGNVNKPKSVLDGRSERVIPNSGERTSTRKTVPQRVQTQVRRESETRFQNTQGRAVNRTVSRAKSSSGSPAIRTTSSSSRSRSAVRPTSSSVKPAVTRNTSSGRSNSAVRTPTRSAKPAITRTQSRTVSKSVSSAPKRTSSVRSSGRAPSKPSAVRSTGRTSGKSATVKAATSRSSGSKSTTSRRRK